MGSHQELRATGDRESSVGLRCRLDCNAFSPAGGLVARKYNRKGLRNFQKSTQTPPPEKFTCVLLLKAHAKYLLRRSGSESDVAINHTHTDREPP